MLGIRYFLLINKNLIELVILILGRQVEQREIIGAFIVSAGIGKGSHTLRINQGCAYIRELPRCILLALLPSCLYLEAPVATNTP